MTNEIKSDVVADLISATLSRTNNRVIDAILDIVVGLKAEVAERKDDNDSAQDDAYSQVIASIHKFQLQLNQGLADEAAAR